MSLLNDFPGAISVPSARIRPVEQRELLRLVPRLLEPVPTLDPELRLGYTEADSLERARDHAAFWLRCESDQATGDVAARLVASDFWAWLALVAWSRDEKAMDLAARLRPAPPLECYRVYARWLTERTPEGRWARPVTATYKSRQIWVTWIAVHLLLWLAVTRPQSYLPILSKDQRDANKVAKRVWVAWRRLPRWLRSRFGVRPAPLAEPGDSGPQELRLGNGSTIQSLPSGEHASRGTTATAVLIDEASVLPRFGETLATVRGGLDDRSIVMTIANAYPSEFSALFWDRLDGQGNGGIDVVEHESLGLRMWRNRFNRVWCCRFHDDADPPRREIAWKESTKVGISLDQWRREHEIDDTIRKGVPVFPSFDRAAHVMRVEPMIIFHPGNHVRARGWWMWVPGRYDSNGEPAFRECRLIRAMDHATTDYFGALWFAVDREGDWFAFQEYYVRGHIAASNAWGVDQLSDHLRLDPEAYAVDVIDALGHRQIAEGKIIDEYREWRREDGTLPFWRTRPVEKGPGSRLIGTDAINAMLLATRAREQPRSEWWGQHGYSDAHRASLASSPALYISPRCSHFVDEILAARYEQRRDGDPTREQPETMSDTADHLRDCARYAIQHGRASLADWWRPASQPALPGSLLARS